MLCPRPDVQGGITKRSPVGIPIAVLGILYVWAIGVRMIPERNDQKAEATIGERKYQADVMIVADSPLVGKTLKDAKITGGARLNAVKLIRGEETVRGQRMLTGLELQAGDGVFIEGLRGDLLKIKDIQGLEFKGDVQLTDPDSDKEQTTIVEGILLPRSPLIGKSLRGLDFRNGMGSRFWLFTVLAVCRRRSARRGCAWATCCCYKAHPTM